MMNTMKRGAKGCAKKMSMFIPNFSIDCSFMFDNIGTFIDIYISVS